MHSNKSRLSTDTFSLSKTGLYSHLQDMAKICHISLVATS